MPRKKSTDAAYPSPQSVSDTKRDRWQVRDALSTLTRAEEIKRDGSLMREVKREAKLQTKSLQSVVSKPSRKK